MQYNELASPETIAKTKDALSTKGIETVIVADESGALEKIRSWIPKDASVMNG